MSLSTFHVSIYLYYCNYEIKSIDKDKCFFEKLTNKININVLLF